MWILGLNGLMLMRKLMMMMMVTNVKRAMMKNKTIGDKDNDKQDHDCDFDYFPRNSRSLYVSGLKQPTYPSPMFMLAYGRGRWAVSQKWIMIRNS